MASGLMGLYTAPLVEWQSAICWDVTVTPLGESYINAAALRRQSLLLPARKRSMLILMADTSLSRSPLRPWAFVTHQVACGFSVGKFPRVQWKPEKRAFCSKDARCLCHTASWQFTSLWMHRLNVRTNLCIFFNFLNSLGIFLTEG